MPVLLLLVCLPSFATAMQVVVCEAMETDVTIADSVASIVSDNFPDEPAQSTGCNYVVDVSELANI